jgi:hypothetical protein
MSWVSNLFKTLPPLQYQLLVRELETYTLSHAPSGWEGSLIEIKRDDKYYGLLNTFSIPADFVLEGASILRTEFYVYGLRADVKLLVNELDAPTQTYKNIFTGRIDFSNVKDYGALDGYKFTANVLPDDMTSLIHSYEDTAYQIPIDVPDAVLIQIPGIQLNEQATLNFSTSPDFRSNAFFALTIVTNQINSIYPSIQNSGFVAQDSPNFITTGEWFLTSQVANNVVNCYGNMGISLAPYLGGPSRYQINIHRSSDGSIVKTLFDQTVSVTSQFNFTWDFTMNGAPGSPLAPLAKGETLSCYFQNFDGQTNKGFNMQYGTMFLSYDTVSPPSNIKALPATYVYKFLIAQIYGMEFNGFTFPTQSNILSTAPWNQLCITSGDAFRPALVNFQSFSEGSTLTPGDYYTVTNPNLDVGATVTYNGNVYTPGDIFVCLPTNVSFTSINGAEVESGNNPAVIKTTFRDFFKSLNGVLKLGFGVQNGFAVLESRDTFFQMFNIVNLPDIQKVVIEPYIPYIFNSIKCGYPDQTYDVLSGRKEANSQVQYSTPNNKVKKEYDITSIYRADPYGIEFLRIQQGSQNVTKGDNDVFLIMRSANVVPDQVYYVPEGTALDSTSPYTSIAGVDTGYFNYSITPKQNLKRHGNFIAGMLDKWEGQILVAEALKSIGLVTINTSGVSVSESAPVDISTLPTALFLPYVATITTDLPINILKLLTMFPTGYISFEVDGNTYYGFLISASFDPAKNKQREYKLLLTPQNNMLNLIH